MLLILLNSNKVEPSLTFIIHLTKDPLPLPIREFLDFLEIGKLAFKKTHTLK
jgi:hypothetical protein